MVMGRTENIMAICMYLWRGYWCHFPVIKLYCIIIIKINMSFLCIFFEIDMTYRTIIFPVSKIVLDKLHMYRGNAHQHRVSTKSKIKPPCMGAIIAKYNSPVYLFMSIALPI